MQEFNCHNLVFSSSATVYDQLFKGSLTEEAPLLPSNPYGESKLEVEKILNNIYLKKSNKWNVVILRYFNPIGAHQSGLLGESPKGRPNNIFPLMVKVAAKELKNLIVLEIK